MIQVKKIFCCTKEMGGLVALCLFALGLLLVPGMLRAEEQTGVLMQARNEALVPGEILTYDISWSDMLTAGTAIMEIKEEALLNGEPVLRLIVMTHSVGLLDKFYRINDRLESVFDPGTMQSIKFSLDQSHGTRKKHRELVFDHEHNTVISKLNNEAPEIISIPDDVQDALSSLYYLRAKKNFVVGKTEIIEVHDSGKNWSVEVQALSREKISTLAGKFATIKVRTFPKYEGVFMNSGEIFVWFTDDSRRIPVLMKSTISIGAIVATLSKMEQATETGVRASRPPGGQEGVGNAGRTAPDNGVAQTSIGQRAE